MKNNLLLKIIIPVIIVILIVVSAAIYLNTGAGGQSDNDVPDGAEEAAQVYLEEIENLESLGQIDSLRDYVHTDSPEMNRIDNIESFSDTLNENESRQVLSAIQSHGRIANSEVDIQPSNYNSTRVNYTILISIYTSEGDTIVENNEIGSITVEEKNSQWKVTQSTILPPEDYQT